MMAEKTGGKRPPADVVQSRIELNQQIPRSPGSNCVYAATTGFSRFVIMPSAINQK
jgi:hypothetical protein